MNTEVALLMAHGDEELVSGARDVHPGLAARRSDCAQGRMVPQDTIQALLCSAHAGSGGTRPTR